jgi:hypothetical protein
VHRPIATIILPLSEGFSQAHHAHALLAINGSVPSLACLVVIHTISERGNGRGNYSELEAQTPKPLRGYMFVMIDKVLVAGAGYIEAPTLDIAA